MGIEQLARGHDVQETQADRRGSRYDSGRRVEGLALSQKLPPAPRRQFRTLRANGRHDANQSGPNRRLQKPLAKCRRNPAASEMRVDMRYFPRWDPVLLSAYCLPLYVY